ncbi:MAG: hypothetical protein ABIN01_21250 [Ferruginibacter sp.]
MVQDEKQMTLEQIEAHIKAANFEQYDKPQAHAGTAAAPAAALDLGAQLKRICAVYKGIKPILTVVVNFPLIPTSIKNAIKTFMSVMNSICP